jgi:uncharacterized protein YbjT (DUF2867 family)
MRILVIGGYGLIGGAAVTRLAAHGHIVYGGGRDIVTAQRRFPEVRWVKADLASEDTAWDEILTGIDAVVNCTAALRDSGRDTQHAQHLEGLARLAKAAKLAGVKRIVHVSAAGSESGADPVSKAGRAAEAALAAAEIDWVVLRPGVILAAGAFGVTALFRALAAFPGFVPAFHPQAMIQVAALHDVAEAIAAAVQLGAPKRMAIDLVNAEPISMGVMLQTWRAWLGAPPAPVVPLPPFLTRMADGLALLGWRSPLRSAAMAQLANGVRGDSTAATRWLGVRMRGMTEILALAPSGVQERWFARLYLLKPLVFIMLAGFWIATGLIGLVQHQATVNHLTDLGLPTVVADDIGWAVAVIALIQGLLICWRRTVRAALIGLLAVSGLYVLLGGLLNPALWADPTGPLLKVFPCAVLSLVALAILDER